MEIKVEHGNPNPLGATWDGKGVNFSIYSEHATSIELCLFDYPEDQNEAARIKMAERSQRIWHIYIPDLKPGQLYGYRVYGPYEPHNGHRFNHHKLLIDPYAKAIAGDINWDDAVYGYDINHPDQDKSFSEEDSILHIPKSVVIDQRFDWEDDKPPGHPKHKSIIYEVHIKGFTKMHPGIPENIRGTYAAFAHPVTINYLKELGITAVELMPVQHFTDNYELAHKNLHNYWGYDTIGFFAPEARYSSSGVTGQQVTEFKQMVKELHKAGIEVILDIVYNHTPEGHELGPTFSFKGIDNSTYYKLDQQDLSKYNDYTGTGNTLHAAMPSVLRLMMDSLRYWIIEMHVDGFRFDLAAALAREFHIVDKLSSFFSIIYQDPVISSVKLIAEPWDIGEEGYQIGKFPPEWSEWNGMFRDTMRRFWRGEQNMLKELAKRFAGSSDLYEDNFRGPNASVNFITAHDGFTLSDLVSYNEKHNEMNGSNNEDGLKDNYSWNCGVEGPTDDTAILELRSLLKRNYLVSLFLSQGVPMLTAGDEMGRTQNGNNNAYCHDSELSWVHWDKPDNALLNFVKKLIKLRGEHPAFARRSWFTGKEIEDTKIKDIAWFQPNGTEMNENDWQNAAAHTLGIYLNGHALRLVDFNGNKKTDSSFFIIFNSYHQAVSFKLPTGSYQQNWIKIIDTIQPEATNDRVEGEWIKVEGRSVVVLKEE